jgi:hypothetical protein
VRILFLFLRKIKTIIIMKKQLLVGAFMLASVLTANAQTTLSTQTFEGTPAEINAAGWGVVDVDGDGKNFGLFASQQVLTNIGMTTAVAGSSNFTIANQTLTPIDTADNIFWSNDVELPAGATANLSVRVGSSSVTEEGGTSHYSIYVLTPEILEGIADLAAFKAYITGATADLAGTIKDGSEVVNVNLSAFAGKEISVVFRHHAHEGYAYFFFDDVTFTTGGTAGVNENLLASLSVFPNPATDVINVTNAENILVNGITVTDLNGRTVKTAKFDGVANASISISDLASGIYMMTVSSDKGSMTKKIVKN